MLVCEYDLSMSECLLARFRNSLTTRIAYARRLGARVMRESLRGRFSYLLSYQRSFGKKTAVLKRINPFAAFPAMVTYM